MERVLYRLFDYQKFAPNGELARQIDAAHRGLETGELPDEALEIWAAGDPLPEGPVPPQKPYDQG